MGGAEKVLVNLVNHIDPSRFDITVMTLFGGGVNEQFLKPHIKLINIFDKCLPGNSHIMKLFSPRTLHNFCIKDEYDIEVSYLEGPCARIISGCPHKRTKLVSWIHIEQHSRKKAAKSFRSYEESKKCYNKFHLHAFVSESVKLDFCSLYSLDNECVVLYNTNDYNKICDLAKEPITDMPRERGEYSLIAVGKIIHTKGFLRLARIHKSLRDENIPVHTYILGKGPQQKDIEHYLEEHNLKESFSFLGYQLNPYKYIAKSDIFICSSYAEGFSTAATEAIIVGTPVCTTNVAGMKELLGNNNEYGIITDNNENELFLSIKKLLTNPSLLRYYKQQALLRSSDFETSKSVEKVEAALFRLMQNK